VVEDEIRVLAAVVLVALLGEKPLAKAGALDGLQVLFWDDHVGVDIDDLQRRRDAFQRGELVHRCTSRSEIEGIRAIYGPWCIPIGAPEKGPKNASLSSGRLNRLHIGVGQAEMMADF